VTEHLEALDSRHRAREAALQMLYQWEVGRLDLDQVTASYWEIEAAALADRSRRFAAQLVTGTVAHLQALDALIEGQAEHWRLSRIAVVDRIILRLAVYELLHEASTPAKVVINEAIELAKTFSSPEAIRFVNGVLDGIKRRLEAGELERGQRLPIESRSGTAGEDRDG
jgi:transcription antitermination protein NusB